MIFLNVLVMWGLIHISSTEADLKSDLTVQTTSGIMLGKRSSTLGKNLRLFLGVPYAQPPTGNLRFKPPLALKSGTTEKDATRFAPSCNQPPHLDSVISPLLNPNRAEISEDCLYLNIYVPDNKTPGTQLPVMVWLTGEGFDFADPQQFDASYLSVEGNAIVVTVNYRLSVFGFLSSLSKDAPGNVGLLDQRMALKWVKENIDEFGGQSKNITLFGRFTGAMSAAIHAFSPLSKKDQLFERVILQSGIPVGNWVFERNPLNSTFALAEATNCLFPHLPEIVECLRQLPADILLDSAMSLPQRWRPIYDFHIIFENALKAASRSDYAPVDVMIGINNDEGSLCTIALNAMQSPLYEKILHENITDSDFEELVKMNMLEFYKDQDALLNKLVTYNYNKNGGQVRRGYIEFCSDVFITSRAQKLADIVADKKANVYMYEFAHRPSFSIHPSFIRAGHGDDVLYSFGLPLQMEDLPEDEARLTRRMVQAFTNFARTGNPNPFESNTEWSRYTIAQRQLMSFTTFRDKPRDVKKSSHEDAVVFWNEIIPEAQKRSCPVAPMALGLYTSEALTDTKAEKAFFLGTQVALPTVEYLMVVLLGASGFLFVIFLVAVGLLVKAKKTSAFQRLA